MLRNDISTNVGTCIKIENVSNVLVECAGKKIESLNTEINFSEESVKIDKSTNISLKHCILNVDHSDKPLSIHNSKNIEIANSEISKFFTVAYKTSGLNFHNNVVNGYIELDNINNSILSNNTFVVATGFNNLDAPAAVILSKFGNKNIIRNNSIDGNAKGIYTDRNGADDGVVLNDEQNSVVSNNDIKNIWDCGIETIGTIQKNTMQNNIIKNAGYCGIGGWYWSNWIGNIVSNNTFDNVPKLFQFTRQYGLRPKGFNRDTPPLPADFGIYFKDNVFTNNKIINPRIPEEGRKLSSVFSIQWEVAVNEGEVMPTAKKFFVSNNVFKNNDFSRELTAPIFYPQSGFVDGGNNICNDSENESPFKCK